MAKTEQPPIIEVHGLTKVYREGKGEEVRAVDGVDLNVMEGELLAIIGASGSGKSSLLHLLGTLDSPTSGEIKLRGRKLVGISGRQKTRIRVREMGMIFQSYNLVAALNALENVELPLVYQGVSKRKRRPRAEQMLRSLGLEDRMRHRPSELSGGQQQRVAIARSLIGNPSVVLADELTGNLDTHSSDQIMELVRRFNKEKGQTFVIVTHNPKIADKCDRTIEMRDGKIVKETRR